MMTVKDLQDKLKEFPEESDVIVTQNGGSGYTPLKYIGSMQMQDNGTSRITTCPVLVI